MVIGGLRRRGVSQLLVVLPDGSRSLVPAVWTDWVPQGTAAVSSMRDDRAEDNLCAIDDLVKVRVVVDDLLRRHTESASRQEGGHAVETSVSRASHGGRRSASSALGEDRPLGSVRSAGNTLAPDCSDADSETHQGGDR